MTRANTVWVSPGATAFSCLCETCLELARSEGGSFVEAVRRASVRGALAGDAGVTFARCAAGHVVVVRRVDRPVRLPRRDARQLQLV
ncbi:MAG TPA: hypothetical protein VFB42_14050 [Gaiellaceae bacterium]|nr:hypothetical protein [Gaiellaceae bacterium]